MSPAQQRFGAGFAAGPESLAGFGAQTGRTQLLVDPRRAVEATVFQEHCLDFSGDHGVVRLALSRWQLLLASTRRSRVAGGRSALPPA
jgi:hypothetical protein